MQELASLGNTRERVRDAPRKKKKLINTNLDSRRSRQSAVRLAEDG